MILETVVLRDLINLLPTTNTPPNTPILEINLQDDKIQLSANYENNYYIRIIANNQYPQQTNDSLVISDFKTIHNLVNTFPNSTMEITNNSETISTATTTATTTILISTNNISCTFDMCEQDTMCPPDIIPKYAINSRLFEIINGDIVVSMSSGSFTIENNHVKVSCSINSTNPVFIIKLNETANNLIKQLISKMKNSMCFIHMEEHQPFCILLKNNFITVQMFSIYGV